MKKRAICYILLFFESLIILETGSHGGWVRNDPSNQPHTIPKLLFAISLREQEPTRTETVQAKR